MVTVGLYYDVLPGKAALFTAKFQDVLGLLRTMPGHTSSYLYQRVDDPDSFAILSEWSDPDAFFAFLRSDAFRQTVDWGREQVLRAAPRHKIYPRAENLGAPGR